MKKISIILLFVSAMVLYSCGAKEEKKTKKDKSTTENINTDNKTDDYPDYNTYKPDLKDEKNDVNNDSLISSEVDDKTTTTDDKTLVDKTVGDKTTTDDKKTTFDDKKDLGDKTILTSETKSTKTERFYVVAGSFKKFDNATNLNKYFKKQGYYSMVLPKQGVYNRVALCSYVNELNARKELKKIKGKNKDIKFWLLKW